MTEQRRRERDIRWVGRRVTALALMSLLLASCGSGEGSAASGQALIKATEWKFEASATQLTAGSLVTVTLQNNGKLEHNLQIGGLTADGKEIQLDTQPGHSASVNLTPGKPGTYQYFCTLPGHKEAGMKGQFVVVAK